MIRLAKLPSILLAALISASAVMGQSSSKATVRAVIFPGSGIEESLELYVGEAKEGLLVPLWGGKFTPEFRLPRMDVWRFGHWVEEKNEQGKTTRRFKERGRVEPPSANRIWLAFFQSKPGKDAPLQVKTFGVDEGGLKEGGVAIMNLTQGPIGVELPGKKLKINPAGQTLVEPGSQRGQVYPVKFYYLHEGKPRPFVSTTWFHGERRKRLALVIQAEKEGVPRLLTIDDVAAKDEAAPQAPTP